MTCINVLLTFKAFLYLALPEYLSLNNFLNSDKASVPIWGFLAVLVALNIYHNNNKEQSQLIVENENDVK